MTQFSFKWILSLNCLCQNWGQVQSDALILPELGPTSDPISRHRDRLYHLGHHFAEAIRLTGADCEFYPPETIHIDIDLTPYAMPAEILRERQDILAQLERETKEQGREFFNGPHTRLIDFRASPRDGTENKHLEMTLGPIGWHDYSVVNEVYAQSVRPRTLERFIDFDEVADGRIRNVKLTNILCTETTIVTSDGFALYSMRGGRVSAAQGMITCAVAENIHQDKDQSLAPNREGEILALFKTVLRGIEEEVSPELTRQLDPSTILLLGVAFNLRNFHPELLFTVVVPHRLDEVLHLATQFPGKDYFEGKVLAIPVSRDRAQLHAVLSSGN